MSSAQVRDIDAIRDLRGALITFTEQSGNARDAANMVIQKARDWIENEMPAYWKAQVRRRDELLNEAKGNLHRCLVSAPDDGGPHCTDEREAVRKSKRYLEAAEEKLEKTKYWAAAIEHEINEYNGGMHNLTNLIEIDTPRSIALLENILSRLEAYLANNPTAAPTQTAATDGNFVEEVDIPDNPLAAKEESEQKEK